MKIAFVTKFYNKHQGIPLVVSELAERYSKEHEVHVFAQEWTVYEKYNITFHKVPSFKYFFLINELVFFFSAGNMLKKHKFDIVNIHDPCFYSGGIFTSHAFPKAGIDTINSLNKKAYTGINPLLFIPFKIFYPLTNYNMKNKKTKKIIAVSSLIKDKIHNILNRKNEDVSVVNNGVDLSKFNMGMKKIYRDKIIKKHGLDKNDFIFLFVGYYHLRKGLQFLIKSLKYVNEKRIKILVVGDDDFKKDYILSLIKDNGLEGRVIFAKNQKDVYKYFAAGDALILPSLYDPFGNVVLEAMACEMPVIVSKLAGASDLISNYKNGLILNDPTNVNEIADKILFLYNKKEDIKLISEKARKTAEQYTWNSVADRTYKIYKEVLSS